MAEMTTPALLQEIHRLRKHIRELNNEIERAPRVIKAHQAKLLKQEDGLKERKDSIKKLKVTLNDKEGSLKSANQQLAKYEKQQNEAGNPKEFEALQHEIAHTQGIRQKLEEEILTLMSQLDEANEKLPKQEQELAKGKEDFKTFEKDSADRIIRLKEEIKLAEGELAKVELNVPSSIRVHFDRLVKAYGPDAFAKVDNRACQHCHSTITSEMSSQLQKDTFICCKSCGRALYL
jgi:uncharacterized protein